MITAVVALTYFVWYIYSRYNAFWFCWETGFLIGDILYMIPGIGDIILLIVSIVEILLELGESWDS